MRLVPITALLICAPALLIAQDFSTDFESHAPGTSYDDAEWAADGFDVSWSNGFDSRSTIDTNVYHSGRQSLRVLYPADQHGTSESGGQADLHLPPAEEYYMSYWLRFDENFSWGGTSQGGKLPGIAGGDNCSGCKICDGTNGFSARFMWRTAGRAVLYLYHMDKENTCGDNLDLVHENGDIVHFPRGEWFHMMQRVKINSGNNNDGEVDVWYNGEHVLEVEGIRFVNNGQQVSALYFSTFHGGSGTQWNAQHDSYSWFDDLKISTNKSDVDFTTCTAPELGPDLSLCGTTELTLSTTHQSGVSYQWTKDGALIPNADQATLVVNSAGEYAVQTDSAGCIQTDLVTVDDVLSPDLGPDQDICQTSFITLETGIAEGNFTYNWTIDGDYVGNESTFDAHLPGSYAVAISAEGCDDAMDQVTLTSSLVEVSGDTACNNEPFSLTAVGDGEFLWYDEHGTLINEGTAHTGTMDGPASFYVEDASGIAANVGMIKPTTSDSKAWPDDRYDRKMRFTVMQTLTIDSIWIHPETALDATIRILDEAEQELFSITHEGLDAGLVQIAIGHELEPGNYLMDAVGTTGKLYHSNENDLDIALPYVVDDLISIDGANISWIDNKPYYLFFYNWKVSAGNACAAAPVFLVEADDCLITSNGYEQDVTAPHIPTPFGTTITLQLPKQTSVKVYNIQGQLVHQYQGQGEHTFGQDFESGIHFLEIGQSVYKVMK